MLPKVVRAYTPSRIGASVMNKNGGSKSELELENGVQVKTSVVPERPDESPALGTFVSQGSRPYTHRTGARPALQAFTTSDIGFPDPDMPLTRPEFVRLPRAGQRCPITGLSRSAMNVFVLPTVENRFRAPVRSFVLRRLGARTGIRLVDYQSLIAYIRGHEDRGGQAGVA